MLQKLAIGFALLAVVPLVGAQTYATVTGTVTDPNGLPFAGASITATLTDSSGSPVSRAILTNGQPFNAAVVSANLSSAGTFSLQIISNASFSSPVGSKYLFQVSAPNNPGLILTNSGAWPITLTQAVPASTDIGSALSALASAISFVDLQNNRISTSVVTTPSVKAPGGSSSNCFKTDGSTGRCGGGFGTVSDGAGTTTGNLMAFSTTTAHQIQYLNNVPTTLPFTATQFNNVWQFPSNGINFQTEFAKYQISGGKASEAFDIGMSVPNTSTIFQANGLGVYMECSSSSTFCVPIYTQGYANVASVYAYGANFNVSDGTSGTNYAAQLAGTEIDAQVNNAGSTGHILALSANNYNAATFNGLQFLKGVVGKLSNAILADNDYATNFANIGYLTSTGAGMPLVFNDVAGSSTLGTDSTNRLVSNSPEFVAPALGTSSSCDSSASPAVCGNSTSGIVAVPAGGTTLVVNTTGISTGSQVQLTFSSALGTALGVTCNTTINQPTESARSAGTSFTIKMANSISTNPDCISYTIINALAGASGGFQMQDTFTGTNGTTLSAHTADTGQSWIQTAATLWVSTLSLNGSNQLTPSSTAFATAYYANFAPSSANYTVSLGCTLGASGGGWCQPFARIQSPASSTIAGYGCLFDQGLGIELLTWSGAGSHSQIGSTDTSVTSGTHTIGIKVNGTTITCMIDGSPSASATGTDSTYITTGYAGLAESSSSVSGYTINSPFTVQ